MLKKIIVVPNPQMIKTKYLQDLLGIGEYQPGARHAQG